MREKLLGCVAPTVALVSASLLAVNPANAQIAPANANASAQAQPSATIPPPPGLRPGDVERILGWLAMPDIHGHGPFPADYHQDANADYVVYQPMDLAQAAQKRRLGVYVWGNGACSYDGTLARFHLTEIASHGYIAIAPGRIQSGPRAEKPNPSAPKFSRPEQMVAAIDWMVKENGRVGSPYYHRIDLDRIVAGGNSCGGLMAMRTAIDPRVRILSVQNSGTFPDGANPLGIMAKDDLSKLHTPILYVVGGPEDVAEPNALADFSVISNREVFVADHPGTGHVGLFLYPYGEGTAIELDWLAWHLDHNPKAAKTFVGADCGLCKDAHWRVYRKGMPAF